MVISEVNILPIKPKDGLVGFASIVVNGDLYLGSIAILAKTDGSQRILYPTKKVGDKSINLFHPINRDASKAIESAITNRYHQIFNTGNEYDRYDKISSAIF